MKYFEQGDGNNIVVSNSSLSAINPEQGGSPRKFIDFLSTSLNEDKSYYRFGNLVDKAVQYPDRYTEMIPAINRPTDMWVDFVNLLLEQKEGTTPLQLFNSLGKLGSVKNPDTFQTKFENEAKYYADFMIQNKGLEIYTISEKENLINCIESLRLNNHINKFLFQKNNKEIKFNQVAIYFEIKVKVDVGELGKNEKVINLKCKALLDQLIISTDKNNPYFIINDVKTTGKPISQFNISFERYRYYRQFAFYILAVQRWLMGKGEAYLESTGRKILCWKPKPNCNFYCNNLVVEKERYNYSECVEVPYNSNWLIKGTDEYKSLLKRIGWHIAKEDFYNRKEAINGYSRIKDFNKN